jgi:hypothetical protein
LDEGGAGFGEPVGIGLEDVTAGDWVPDRRRRATLRWRTALRAMVQS